MKTIVAALLAASGLSATGLHAQQADRFRIAPVFGVVRFDKTSALSATDGNKLWASGGLSADYAVTPSIRAGLYLEYQRPTTSADYYPYALFRTGSSYTLNGVSQVVSVLSYGIQASYNLPGRWGPFVRGGVGRHSVYADVQSQFTTQHIDGTQFLLGAGINYGVSETVGVRLELTDFMWSNWDRDDLNPVAPQYQNTTFPEENPAGITLNKPSLIHNLRLAVGFSFTPSSGASR